MEPPSIRFIYGGATGRGMGVLAGNRFTMGTILLENKCVKPRGLGQNPSNEELEEFLPWNEAVRLACKPKLS